MGNVINYFGLIIKTPISHNFEGPSLRKANVIQIQNYMGKNDNSKEGKAI